MFTAEDLMRAYEYGIDHGLLLAEQERDSEDLPDAMGCMLYSRRRCVPSAPALRRQPHSEAWRTIKKDSFVKFIELVIKEE